MVWLKKQAAFYMVPAEICCDKGAPRLAMTVLGEIVSSYQLNGVCNLSNGALAQHQGSSPTRIKEALGKLSDAGWIRLDYAGPGNIERTITPLWLPERELQTQPENGPGVARKRASPQPENGHREYIDIYNNSFVTTPAGVGDEEKPKRAKKQREPFAHDSNPYIFAKYLSDKIQERKRSGNPANETTLQSWAADFDKCNRLDGHEWDEISPVLGWCQADGFWQNNILSGSKFRKQYNQLLMKATKAGVFDE